jgi:hypothetical protein
VQLHRAPHGLQLEGDVLGGADAFKVIRFAVFDAESVMAPPLKRRPLIERNGDLLAVAASVTLVIAGSSYWLSMRRTSLAVGVDRALTALDRSAATQMSQPSVSVRPTVTPQVIPVRLPDQHESVGITTAQEQVKAAVGHGITSDTASMKVPGVLVPPKQIERSADPRHSSAAQASNEPSGQSVRIGRFATRSDAEKAWVTVLHRWPDMQSLRVVPVPITSLRDGKTYYRLQVGTSSREHSEGLCRRSHDLDQSCTVIGSDQNSAESPI